MKFPLLVHEESYSPHDLIVSGEFKDQELVGIELKNELLVLRGTAGTMKFSIQKHIAAKYELVPRQIVQVSKVREVEVIVTLVEVSFRDQYIGRADMWMLKKSLIGEAVHVGKKVSCLGVKGRISAISVGDKERCSGVISETTKFIFRSESAKFFIFIQMSKEMWEFDEHDGELMFEKCVQGFFPELFTRWKEMGCSHVLSIIMFARVVYDEEDGAEARNTKDFYKVIVDSESRADWNSILGTLKKQFHAFQEALFQVQNEDGTVKIAGSNTHASDGNILETINLALNPFDKHYIDRDLTRTGLQIVVISPGSGIFNVDKHWCRLTTQRMIDIGVALDLVCLSKPPLHAVPLLIFKSKGADYIHVDADGNSPNSSWQKSIDKIASGSLETRKNTVIDYLYVDDNIFNYSMKFSVYMTPDWIDISYWTRPNNIHSLNIETFIPRCKLVGSDEIDNTFEIEPLNLFDSIDERDFDEVTRVCERYDKSLFEIEKKPKPGPLKPKLQVLEQQNSEPNIRHTMHEDLMDFRQTRLEFARMATSVPKQSSPLASWQANYMTPSAAFTDKRRVFEIIDKEDNHQYSAGIQPIHIVKQQPQHRESRVPRGSYDSNQSLSSRGSKDNSPLQEKTLLRFSPSKTPTKHFLRHSYANPFVNHTHIKTGAYERRWEHMPKWISHQGDQLFTNWNSLCSPACLPLTITNYPSLVELSEFFQEYTYTVSPSFDGAAQNQKINELIVELIKQRLSQGYQLIEDSATAGKGMYGKDGEFKSKPYYVCLGDNIHRLFYDATGNNIEVKRYTRRVNYSRDPIPYQCSIWSTYSKGYEDKEITLHYPGLGDYNWNYLDHLISGYQEEMPDSLRFWRVRFLLIPLENAPSPAHSSSPEKLLEEEERVLGFFKFFEIIEKLRYNGPTDKPKKLPNSLASKLPIQLTTTNLSSLIASEDIRGMLPEVLYGATSPFSTSSMNILPQLSKLSPLETVTNLLFSPPPSGLSFKNRYWRLQAFRNVSTGTEIVDWILSHFSDIQTREAAVEYGNSLLIENGILEHARSNYGLLDGFYFYRPCSKWKIQNNQEQKNLGKTRIHCVRQVALDMDPMKKSQRKEIAYLHYDSTHNPDNCYHIELHWIACTASLIDEIVHIWSRTAEKNGFKFVEAPRAQSAIGDDFNPFQGYYIIKFSVDPPDSAAVMAKLTERVIIGKEYFAGEVLKHMNFVMDTEADSNFPPESRMYSYYRKEWPYTQFVHRSGMAFIRILPDNGGLVWNINHLHLANLSKLRFGFSNATGVSNTSNAIAECDGILQALESFCSDPAVLGEFWEETERKIVHIKSGLPGKTYLE